MYKISDISKITSLSVKALRYYDEERILTPSRRDEETSYRYYSEEDFQKAQLIVLLRSLEFSISEIKDVLANCGGPADLPCYLEEKKLMIDPCPCGAMLCRGSTFIRATAGFPL